MRRRKVEVFSLSFLDCICCGFGAVVLFYTIIAGQAGSQRIQHSNQLQAEVNRTEEQVLEGARNLVVLRNTLEKTEIDTRKAAARTAALLDEVSASRDEALRVGATSMAQRENINHLKADVQSLEEGTKKLQAGAITPAPAGPQVRAFRGTGNRKYLTGINLKGKRILVLIDRLGEHGGRRPGADTQAAQPGTAPRAAPRPSGARPWTSPTGCRHSFRLAASSRCMASTRRRNH